jgi:hypothetical protein
MAATLVTGKLKKGFYGSSGVIFAEGQPAQQRKEMK